MSTAGDIGRGLLGSVLGVDLQGLLERRKLEAVKESQRQFENQLQLQAQAAQQKTAAEGSARTLSSTLSPKATLQPNDVATLQGGGMGSLVQPANAKYLEGIPQMAPGSQIGAGAELPRTQPTFLGTFTQRKAQEQADATANEHDLARQQQQSMLDERIAASQAAAKEGQLNRESMAKMAAGLRAPQLIQVQTVDENGNKVTRIVPKTSGAEYKAPANAVTSNRADSAQAVIATGNDIVSKLSDPNYMATAGPALGRYNTLRDFIGNPPPEFADLAGNIESFALANMGVHGMRSNQGAEAIKQLLDQHHTPQSLIATVKGLTNFSNHFMEAAGQKVPGPKVGPAAPAPPVVKPSIQELLNRSQGGR